MLHRRCIPRWIALVPLIFAANLVVGVATAAEPVQFNRDVRPILADACFRCHGPDSAARQAELRLDTEEDAKTRREDRVAVVPGKRNESELWRRITSSDADERMPPADSGKSLSPEQIATLGRWIDEGAKWERHWSFLPVQRPVPPKVKPADEVRNSIDAFIRDRLAKEKLASSPPAEKATLLRRATLDLTGLPPTPDELAAFLADERPDAYERVVDRLLASPRYGERMAATWLNAARYADTHGYQSDGERIMWRWRDWVIEAFNANKPFDQFTIEQLAGDLLPSATLDQLLATGFNRNHRGNSEGGIVPEEYAVEYVVDRVETTSTVWLGLTMGCVRCHDHKFDPFSQADLYRLYALFNNVPEKGRAVKIGNSPPYLVTPTRLQQEELKRRERAVAERLVAWEALEDRVDREQAAWERSPEAESIHDWQPADDLVAELAFDELFDGRQSASIGDTANFGFFDKFTLSAWIRTDEASGTIISRMTDVAEGDGYQLALARGKLQLNLVKRWLDDSTRVETAEPLTPGPWHHVAATYDGSREASGIKLYVDGVPQKLNVLLDELNQTFAVKQPLRIGGGGGPGGLFRGQIDGVRIYRYDLAPNDIAVLATRRSIRDILAWPRDRRLPAEQAKLRACFLAKGASPEIVAARNAFLSASRELRAYRESLPTTMVMEEMPELRPTHVLTRGQYDQPGARVEGGLLETLAPRPDGAPANRLGLAKWLVAPAHPLTARVAVNRYWQQIFGTGLVKTAEDFGAQGEWPLYPELLDWLASDFREEWDVKRLMRRVVTSGTYRQSSAPSAELVRRDSENRLLARGPRLRMPVEMVRDQALAASGLLVEQIGGPSVKPPQPAGLWSELTGGDDYVPGQGADHYRRSLYTFWKRTIPPPSLTVFDAATREFCTVRESRTNTPLQALTLLNDPAYVEAARLLAERVLLAESSATERLALAFSLVLGRQPSSQESEVLLAALTRHSARFAAAPEEASQLIAVGQLRPSSEFKPTELAAYAAVCSTILNLDEAVTKE